MSVVRTLTLILFARRCSTGHRHQICVVNAFDECYGTPNMVVFVDRGLNDLIFCHASWTHLLSAVGTLRLICFGRRGLYDRRHPLRVVDALVSVGHTLRMIEFIVKVLCTCDICRCTSYTYSMSAIRAVIVNVLFLEVWKTFEILCALRTHLLSGVPTL